MQEPLFSPGLEEQIGLWRSYILRRRALGAGDAAELEDHLREEVAALAKLGLAEDEAFLVAVKRLGGLDQLSREFAREHSERLWKQLVLVSPDASAPGRGDRAEAWTAILLALGAALAVKAPGLFGLPPPGEDAGFLFRNLSFFVLPFVTAFFFWKRSLSAKVLPGLAGIFLAAAGFANVYPLGAGSSTGILQAIHLPLALWLAVGAVYAGGRLRESGPRMDFIRFSGELLIYYALIALGGGVLAAFSAMIFGSIGMDPEPFFESWLIPCGAMGGIVVAAWLVEAKQAVIENMAPVLTRLFTPLFAAALLIFLGAALWTGRGVDIEREVLIAFDLLLVVVLGLLIFSLSARDPAAPPGAFDAAQLVLILGALASDALALAAIAARISAFGTSPNRVAALGVNLILLVNLAGAAVLHLGFLRRRVGFARVEKWQTDYLPVYGVWAVLVVIAFPPLFGFA